jgi:hypothetical protein
MPRFCHSCGAALPEPGAFCSACGALVESDVAPTKRDNRHSEAVSATLDADRRLRVRLGLAAATLGVLLLGIVVMFANRGSPPVANPAATSPVIPTNEAKPSPAPPEGSTPEQHEAASSAVTPVDNPQDHELHLMPNLFGHGAISDTRTYSVALIADYRGYLPHGTELFMQGRLVNFGPGSATLVDEQHNDKNLLCYMTEDEFDDVIHLYRVGEAVQIVGEYAGQTNMPVFNNCRVASPTKNVVRPAEAAHPAQPTNGEANKSAESTDGSRAASSASATTRSADHPSQLQFEAGVRVFVHVVSISRQPDGGFTFRGTLLQPVALADAASLDQGTELAGSGTVNGGHVRVLVTGFTVRGKNYRLQAASGANKRAGSGPAIELDPGKVLEMWFASASVYQKTASPSTSSN